MKMMSPIRENVALFPMTTIGLGGPARYYASCKSADDVRRALEFANKKSLPVMVLGGGSNTIIPDEGFHGLVIHPAMRGMEVESEGDLYLVRVGAGEPWDDFVLWSLEMGCGELAFLSGIPGDTGAVPVQNVGAYGYEISSFLKEIQVIDRDSMEELVIPAEKLELSYRKSRLKGEDAGKYIILSVSFLLRHGGQLDITYSDLRKRLGKDSLESKLDNLMQIRNTVIDIRREKSMVYDPDDPDSRSAGSFFTNPVVDREIFDEIVHEFRNRGGVGDVPFYEDNGRIKIPAAWLIEQSGFHKGHTHGRVGISSKHTLALVNRGGATSELLELADIIIASVNEKFGVLLVREPVLIEARKVIV